MTFRPAKSDIHKAHQRHELVYPKQNGKNAKLPPIHTTHHLQERHILHKDQKMLDVDLKSLQWGASNSKRSLLEAAFPFEGHSIEEYEKALDWGETDLELSTRIFSRTKEAKENSDSDDLVPVKSLRNNYVTTLKPDAVVLSKMTRKLYNLWENHDYSDILPRLNRMHRKSRTAQRYLKTTKKYQNYTVSESRDDSSSDTESSKSNITGHGFKSSVSGMSNQVRIDNINSAIVSRSQELMVSTSMASSSVVPPSLSQSGSVPSTLMQMDMPPLSQPVTLGTPLTNSQISTSSQFKKKKPRKAGF